VEDNLSVYGSIGGAGRASTILADEPMLQMSPGDNSTVVIVDGEFSPYFVFLPQAMGSGIIYTIYNADEDNISLEGITPINPAHGQGGDGAQTHQVAPGTKTDCVDVGGNNGWKCFSY
jgi:hypothetical protein